MTTEGAYQYEKRWGFLRPWTRALTGELENELYRLQSPSLFESKRFYIPAMHFSRSVRTHEGLKLLAAVAHVDHNAWKYLLLYHCGVTLSEPWDEVAEGDVTVQFHLTMVKNNRNVQDLVQMCGIQQHDYLSREYSEALTRIAAIGNEIHSKICGVEIPVPIVVHFINSMDSAESNLDDVLWHRNVGEKIQQDLVKRALPHVEAGAFRCAFVFESAIKANLSQDPNQMDMKMAEKIEELIHANVWFSLVSLEFNGGYKDTEWGTRFRRESMGRLITSLFDSTRRLRESPTAATSITHQQVDKMSVLEWCQKDWEALCSAAPQGQTVRKLTLSSTRNAQLDKWWQWLAYGFFSKRARTNSSLETLTLKYIPCMATPAIDAFCAVLSSEIPEELLFGCTSGADGVQDATLMANSPIRWNFNEQNEPVVTSDVLNVATPIRFLRILSGNAGSEWVNALIPGYGLCQVQQKNLVFSEHVDIVPGKNLKALEISFMYGGIIDIDTSGLPRFLTAVGPFLKTISLDTAEMSVDANMVLERCPNLEHLGLKTYEDVAVFDFSDFQAADLALPAIRFDMNDIPTFTEELMNRDSALSNCLQRLTVSWYPNWATTPEYRDTLLRILASNERLEYLRIQFPRLTTPSRDYVKRFKSFHLQPINRSIRLDLQSKIAFLSALWTTRQPQIEKRKPGGKQRRMNWENIDENVVSTIFQFAESPILRKVYVV